MIGEKFEGLTANMKNSTQSSGYRGLTIALRLLTGLILGYVIGLIGRQLMGYGYLGVILFVVVTTAVFFKISSQWSLLKVFLFDIFCVLVLQILRMYILLAP